MGLKTVSMPMANTPVFTIGAVSAASTQLSVCRCRSAFATSPAQSPHKTALPTHTTTSQNGLATHKRFVNSSVPVMPATRQTIPNIAPRPAPAPGPNKIAPTTMGTSVSEIGTGPMRIPLATVCKTTTSAASKASEVRRTTDAWLLRFISTSCCHSEFSRMQRNFI